MERAAVTLSKVDHCVAQLQEQPGPDCDLSRQYRRALLHVVYATRVMVACLDKNLSVALPDGIPHLAAMTLHEQSAVAAIKSLALQISYDGEYGSVAPASALAIQCGCLTIALSKKKFEICIIFF